MIHVVASRLHFACLQGSILHANAPGSLATNSLTAALLQRFFLQPVRMLFACCSQNDRAVAKHQVIIAHVVHMEAPDQVRHAMHSPAAADAAALEAALEALPVPASP